MVILLAFGVCAFNYCFIFAQFVVAVTTGVLIAPFTNFAPTDAVAVGVAVVFI